MLDHRSSWSHQFQIDYNKARALHIARTCGMSLRTDISCFGSYRSLCRVTASLTAARGRRVTQGKFNLGTFRRVCKSPAIFYGPERWPPTTETLTTRDKVNTNWLSGDGKETGL